MKFRKKKSSSNKKTTKHPNADFFSNFVCRISGLPVHLVDNLDSKYCKQQIDFILTLEEKLLNAREEISQILYHQIKNEKNRKIRNQLLKLRRDMYNLRKINNFEVKLFPHHQSINEYFNTLNIYHKKLKSFKKNYNKELEIIRNKFKFLIKNQDFLMGVQLSSHHLYNDIEKYFMSNSIKLKGKEKKIERSLLKYFTRMSMKATPFAKFCKIIPGYFVEHLKTKEKYQFNGNLNINNCEVRLNKDLHRIIKDYISTSKIKKNLLVQLNPSIEHKNKTVFFLDTTSLTESFRRIKVNPAIEFIINLFQEADSFTLEELTKHIHKYSQYNSPKSKVEEYLDHLLKIGFLKLWDGIFLQEIDWDKKLTALLSKTHDITANSLASSIKLLRQNLSDFQSTSSTIERTKYLNDMQSIIKRTMKEVKLNSKVSTPLFEDTTAPANLVIPRTEQIKKLRKSLANYILLTQNISTANIELANMRHFFDSQYTSKIKSVPLLKFHEDYYRKHYKDFLSEREDYKIKENRKNLNPFKLEYVTSILEAQDHFKFLIAEKWLNKKNQEINISVEDLKKIIQSIPNSSNSENWSSSVFCELILQKNSKNSRVLIPSGGYLTGFGKMFSRFLYLFPTDFTHEIQENNIQLMNGQLTELSDDANFNANLHPPLTPSEISYPPGQTRNDNPAIPLTDIEVIRHPSNNFKLQLQKKYLGNKILPLDGGFLSINKRQPLYKMLSSFCSAINFFPKLPISPTHTTSGDKNSSGQPIVLERPRIVFDNKIVLARKCWFVPAVLYPVLKPNEKESDYLLRLSRWRDKWKIPSEVYVRYLPEDQFESKIKGKRINSNWRNFRKPQYINFQSPLLVSLFGISHPKKNFIAVLEERYPAKNLLFSDQKNSYATEFILQIDFKI